MTPTTTAPPTGSKAPGTDTAAKPRKRKAAQVSPSPEATAPDTDTGTTPEPGDLLKLIAQDRRQLAQLAEAKKRITGAMKNIQGRITENERAVYEPYTTEAPEPLADTIRQLELF